MARRACPRDLAEGNVMRWPWQKPERRESGGDFSDAVVRLDRGSSGRLGGGCVLALRLSRRRPGRCQQGLRERRGASVRPGSQNAVNPSVLAQIGRDLVRSRAIPCMLIRVGGDGMVRLIPCSSWHLGRQRTIPSSWTVRATAYGPSTSTTWNLPASAVDIRSVGIRTPVSPMSGWRRHHGPTQRRASGSEIERGLLRMKSPARWPSSSPCRKTAAPMTATMTRLRCSEGRYPLPPAARRCWSKRPPNSGWGEGKNRRAVNRRLAATAPGPGAARRPGAASPRCVRARPGRDRDAAVVVHRLAMERAQREAVRRWHL